LAVLPFTTPQKPVPVCPDAITRTTEPGVHTARVTFTPTASDNSKQVTVTCSPTSGFAFPVGTTEVVCTAVDPSKNSQQCAFNVNVEVRLLLIH
jgi:hypothetical protein